MRYHVFTIRSGREAGARARMERHGLDVTILTETRKVRTGRKGERVAREYPLMPGYAFATGDVTEELVQALCGAVRVPPVEAIEGAVRARGQIWLNNLSPVTGVLRTAAGAIATLSQAEIDTIERMAKRQRAKAVKPKFAVGDTVRAMDGPLVGFRGLIAAVVGDGYRWEVVTDRGPFEVTTDGKDLAKDAA